MNAKQIEIDEDELDELYEWIDKFTLSRKKRNIARDFSDGVLVAEIVNELYPGLADTSSLVPSLNTDTKKGNWETLNRKVFTKMGFRFLQKDIEDIVTCKPLAIENAIRILRVKFEVYDESKRNEQDIYMNYGQGKPAPIESKATRQQDAVDRLVAERSAEVNKSHQRVPIKSMRSPSNKKEPSKIPKGRKGSQVDPYDDLKKKDQHINDLQQTIGIMELKISKLEQLVSLKEHKIEMLEKTLKDIMSQQQLTDSK